MTYVFIPPGNFKMGCSKGDTECGYGEWFPLVQIANGFWLGQTEVTQAAWEKLNGGGNPSHFKGESVTRRERGLESSGYSAGNQTCSMREKLLRAVSGSADWDRKRHSGRKTTAGVIGRTDRR